MKYTFPVEEIFLLHYEGEEEESGESQEPETKTYTQEDVDSIVKKRTEEATRKQKSALRKLEEIQKTAKMTDEQRAEMEAELEDLRSKVLTTDEIAKRKQKEAEQKYESQLTDAQKAAQDWEARHNQLMINYEITQAAQSNKVIPEQVPFLEAFFGPRTKIVPVEDGGGFQSVVTFQDRTAEGKPLEVEVSVGEAIKRMSELPDQYGHMFASESGGGLGGSNGKKPGSTKIDWSNMTEEQAMKLRAENPDAFYGKK